MSTDIILTSEKDELTVCVRGLRFRFSVLCIVPVHRDRAWRRAEGSGRRLCWCFFFFNLPWLLILHPLVHLHIPLQLHRLNHDIVVWVMQRLKVCEREREKYHEHMMKRCLLQCKYLAVYNVEVPELCAEKLRGERGARCSGGQHRSLGEGSQLARDPHPERTRCGLLCPAKDKREVKRCVWECVLGGNFHVVSEGQIRALQEAFWLLLFSFYHLARQST